MAARVATADGLIMSLDDGTNEPIGDKPALLRAETLAVMGLVGTFSMAGPLFLSFQQNWGPIAKMLLLLALPICGIVWVYFTIQGLRRRSLNFLDLRSTIASYVFLAFTGICVAAFAIVAQTTKSDDFEKLIYVCGAIWILVSIGLGAYIFMSNLAVSQSFPLAISTTTLQLFNLVAVAIIYLIVLLAKDHEFAQKDQERFLRRRALQRYDGL